MKWAFVAASALGYGYLSFLHTRSEFLPFVAVVAILFSAYYFFYTIRRQLNWDEVLMVAIAFRLLFLFHTPEMSNDFYRFLWDGMITADGQNPYLHRPENDPYFSAYHTDGGTHLGSLYYAQMNSPQYYSPYPPVCQFIWGFAESFFSTLTSKLVLLRLLILLFEIGTILLLRRILLFLKKDVSPIALYALNPLIILELTGNLHPEVFMLFFLTLAYYLYLQTKMPLSAVSFGLAVASKFIPLIILPFLARKIGWKKTIQYSLIVGATCILVFLPYYDPIILQNIQSSVGLYFGQFYFNASIFYVVKEMSDWVSNRDLRFEIAPILSIISTTVIISLAFLKRKPEDFFVRLLFAFTIYFLMSTTVHPWYIGIIVLIGVVTTYTFPFAWSMLVLLSYSHYEGGRMQEHPTWIWIEYGVLIIWMTYELWNHNGKKINSTPPHSIQSGL